jgi:hypothetical protein
MFLLTDFNLVWTFTFYALLNTNTTPVKISAEGTKLEIIKWLILKVSDDVSTRKVHVQIDEKKSWVISKGKFVPVLD